MKLSTFHSQRQFFIANFFHWYYHERTSRVCKHVLQLRVWVVNKSVVLRLLFHSWCVAYLQEFWEFYTELCYFNCFQSFYLSQHNNCQHHDPRPYPLSHQLPFQIFGLSRSMHKWYKLSVILKQFENIRKYKLITLFTLNWTKCNILAVHISCVLPTQMHLLILVLPFYQGT